MPQRYGRGIAWLDQPLTGAAATHFASRFAEWATRWACAFSCRLSFLVGCAAKWAASASSLAVASSTWACCMEQGAGSETVTRPRALGRSAQRDLDRDRGAAGGGDGDLAVSSLVATGAPEDRQLERAGP